MINFFKKNHLIILVFILFSIPFFWMKPGEMDLGGDGNRLYYYDPQAYLINDGIYLYDNVIEGIRTIEPHFYNLPFVLFLVVIKYFFYSPYFLIEAMNGIKLSLGFLSVVLIIRLFLQQSFKNKKDSVVNLSSILGGIFYITTPIMIGNYDKALLSQSQVFLNPLLFYLLFVYIIKQKFRYLVYIILITLLFAPNFSWIAAPPVFAFFPLAALFLFLYTHFILRLKINVLHIFIALLLLIGLHAFHLFPELYSLLNTGSYVNERVFSNDNIAQQMNYFYGILPLSKLSYNLLEYAPIKIFPWISIMSITVVLIGLLLNRGKNKVILLMSVFFLITLFLITANITHSGVLLYAFLFTLPGFSMFRNFIGQWAFVFAFFYSLLFGQTVYMVLQRIRNKYLLGGVFLFFATCFVMSAWPFFNGDLVNKVHFQSKGVKIAMTMDPDYEKVLNKIRSLEDDGAIISFPFTDCCYSVVHGKNNGAYVGTSPLTALTGRKDYNGYIMVSPFGEVFLKIVKERDYKSIKTLLGLLNVKYVFYNSDPKVYDANFPGYPFSTVRNYFPVSQKEYRPFIQGITSKIVYKQGPYELYSVNNEYTKPHFYSATALKIYKDGVNDWYGKTESFFIDKEPTKFTFLEYKECVKIFSKTACTTQNKKISSSPKITFSKINPTKYVVNVKGGSNNYLLVFSETFHNSWSIRLKKNNENNITNIFNKQGDMRSSHILVNGFANAWYINPKDVNYQSNYTLIIEMTDQKVFYVGLLVSSATALVALLILFFLPRR